MDNKTDKKTNRRSKEMKIGNYISPTRKEWTMVSHCQDSANFIKDNGDGTITLESFHRYGPSSYKTMTQAEYKAWKVEVK